MAMELCANCGEPITLTRTECDYCPRHLDSSWQSRRTIHGHRSLTTRAELLRIITTRTATQPAPPSTPSLSISPTRDMETMTLALDSNEVYYPSSMRRAYCKNCGLPHDCPAVLSLSERGRLNIAKRWSRVKSTSNGITTERRIVPADPLPTGFNPNLLDKS
jgi:hypothetical protein